MRNIKFKILNFYKAIGLHMMEDLETDLEELEEKLKFYADQILSEEDEEPQKLERLPFSSARSIYDLFSLIIINLMNEY